MTNADVIPFHHPDRPGSEFRPLKAWHHFRKLIADKEDTEQVFHVIAALRGSRFRAVAGKFWHSEKGQRLLATDQRLIDLLDDHETLQKLPAGTVGRAYVEFMQREGLSAAGLEAEYAKFTEAGTRFEDGIDRYGDRLRDTHDLHHILTGYGRDALGEQCVLAFTYAQHRNLGVGFIAYAGGFELKRRVARSSPIMKAVHEGYRIGKAAKNLAQEDIGALLAEPLADARQRLGIPEPVAYKAAHEAMRSGGVDPYNLLAAAA
ncbi:MAG TPA: Coq4 family protein [Sphingorhabdus sp.]|jgi:ubiquinone biosynthesis protein COQ4|nr:Coq4 family protein [Sphingorhabdus sp.]